MTTEYFMTGLFTHVDDQFNEQGINGKHPQAKLYVSEVITLGLQFYDFVSGSDSMVYRVILYSRRLRTVRCYQN